ncbi:Carbon monoxide dehydrogenase large chain [Mycobacterium attenuatum]|uniref:Carbon monoxide dehydrogenase large chain n=1 Tax=Mycobacterium attenuatum TaxID=2341086 RepID=A0A498PWQ7_9MYCO|nr:xanthine dehydrogenase family protein molybdopterin-binding subunit [Mycobacterium attenuatum]VBA38196.1 Carbon monoxide dehydrogenase large chain [Mycobacterium attenuatum]
MRLTHPSELGSGHDAPGPLARSEHDLVRGTGKYVDAIRFAGEAHGCLVRAPLPHAWIRHIDSSRAANAPGVLSVITGRDIAATIRPLSCVIGTARVAADRAVLAVDRVRHVGDGVAFVVAETPRQAAAAAALVDVNYEPLAYRCDTDSPDMEVPIWAEAPDDVCFDWRFGDPQACRELFAAADHVVRMTLASPRIVPYPIEPRAAVGLYDEQTDTMTLLANTQGVHFVRNVLARAFDRDPRRLRVLTPTVGGGFGVKIDAYPEHALVLESARRLRRPVRWTATRSESFLSDTQGRGHVTDAAIALDKDGRFLALSVRPIVDLGAYLSQLAPLTATGVGAPVQTGAYRFQAVEINVRAMFTNNVPVDAFRGAGRPEATYVLERLIDRAARELGFDPAALRARNLPATQTEPITATTGLVIDGGRFLDNQIRCLDVADRAGFDARRRESAAGGRLRGFGFANYLEANGGLQVAAAMSGGAFPVECATLTFSGDGRLDIVVGTQSSGQDHAVPLQQLAAQRLGIDLDRITVREGDSSTAPWGAGTGGSKSTLTSTAALDKALADAVQRGKQVLADKWGVTADAVSYDNGRFLADADAGEWFSSSIIEVAEHWPGALDGQSEISLRNGSFANGCHACELEIDPETGDVTVLRYVAVDDFGRVINEQAVRGQVQGAVTHGIAQALLERAPGCEELMRIAAGDAAAYAPPTACEIPDVEWVDNGLPSTTNVLGAKGCGESGTAAAPPAVMNAIADALRDYPAAARIQMPARPAVVWKAIHDGH